MLPLIPVLRRNKELLTILIDLLSEERMTFSARDTKDLEQVTLKKKDILNELEALEKKQHSILTKFGIINAKNPIKGSFKTWLDSQDPDGETRILVDECESLLLACKSKNSANEKILNTLRRRNKSMLEILKGQSKKHRVYTAKGSSKPVSSKHTIGNA